MTTRLEHDARFAGVKTFTGQPETPANVPAMNVSRHPVRELAAPSPAAVVEVREAPRPVSAASTTPLEPRVAVPGTFVSTETADGRRVPIEQALELDEPIVIVETGD